MSDQLSPDDLKRADLADLAQHIARELRLPHGIVAAVVVTDETGEFIGVGSTCDKEYTAKLVWCAAHGENRIDHFDIVPVAHSETLAPCDLCNGKRTLVRSNEVFWCDECGGTGRAVPGDEVVFGPPEGRVARFDARYPDMKQRVLRNRPSAFRCGCHDRSHGHEHRCKADTAREFELGGWVDSIVLCARCIPKELGSDDPQNQGAP